MAAVPIYVWNGTEWQETGPTIPASPIKYQASAPSSPSTGDIWVDSDGDVTTGSQQFQRFRFVASGGETTISGNDANGATLAYTAGMEQVVLNGAVLVRGHDYTATDGTSITGLSPALVANDVLEVFSFIAFTVANTYTQSQVDGFRVGNTIQVVQGTTTTQVSNATGSDVDTGLTATITPTSSSNKILVLVTHTANYKTANNTGIILKLKRDATELQRHKFGYTGTSLEQMGGLSFTYLDSPSTISPVTYKTTFVNESVSGTVFVQQSGTLSNIILMEIKA